MLEVTLRTDCAFASIKRIADEVPGAVVGAGTVLTPADALATRAQRILLIGGAARNPAVQQLAPAIFGSPVHVPPPAEYVALGAARQAAWALFGTAEPPAWTGGDSQTFTATSTPQTRAAREATSQWDERRPGPA